MNTLTTMQKAQAVLDKLDITLDVSQVLRIAAICDTTTNITSDDITLECFGVRIPGAKPHNRFCPVGKVISDIRTFRDLYQNLLRYGKWSPKQENFAVNLATRISAFNSYDVAEKAKKDLEVKSAIIIQDGKQEIEGTVKSVNQRMGRFGTSLKMTLKRDDGAVFWGSVPTGMYLETGMRIKFTARVTKRDEGFAFFKNPTKAEIL